MPSALLLCTSHFHLEMFDALVEALGPDTTCSALVARQLARRGDGNLSARIIDPSAFSLRGWRRFGSSRRAHLARSLLRESDAGVLVIGNDLAPCERALAHEARRDGLPVVLLQDGLFPAWSAYRWRELAARLAVRIGAVDLAPTVYGCGEAAFVGALGDLWARELRRRAGREVTVAVTGNVAYARILRTARTASPPLWRAKLGLDERPLVTFFTTDVLRGLGWSDRERHARQVTQIRGAATALRGTPWQMRLRLHPAENWSDYRELFAEVEPFAPDTSLAAVLGASDAGLVTGTSVALLLAKLGRPVAWPAFGGMPTVERQASAWLGIPVADGALDTVLAGERSDAARIEPLLADDDAPEGSRSARIIREALRLE